jgi:acyl dehydratase
MAIDYERIMAIRNTGTVHRYGDRETMLYALGIGLGQDPLDRDELPFVYEKGLKVMPTQATVVAWDNMPMKGSGINYLMVLHGEQRLTVHKPLPPDAELVATGGVVGCFDKGKDKGAVVLTETVLSDKATGEKLVTLGSTTFARGDGGFGGPSGGGPAPHPIPDRAPDKTIAYRIAPNAALIYRLSGDRNPLHSDPDVAAAAGFKQPILHGLCSYGHACRAVVQTMCDWDPTRIAGFDVRFSSPVYPGETFETQMWRDGNVVSFRARIVERDVIVLNNGKATLRS